MTAQLIGELARLGESGTLAAYGHFASQQPGEVIDYVGGLFCPHAMRSVGKVSDLDATVDSASLGGISIAFMKYGADVVVEPGELKDFYLIQIPVSGEAHDSFGTHDNRIVPGMASIQHPEDPLRMRWSTDCQKFVVRLDRKPFEQFVEARISKKLDKVLALHPEISLDTLEGRLLIGQIGLVLNCLKELSGSQVPPLLVAQFEMSLMAALVYLQPHDRQRELTEITPVRHEAGAVCRVRDYIAAHADEPLTVDVLACVAGLPVRTLYHQFQRSTGTPPMQMVREVRLDKVRAALLEGVPGSRVTGIAFDWGFEHLGRFALAYKARFGESPRDTLKRSQ